MYLNMTDDEKKSFLNQEYVLNNKSFQNIALEIGLYPNKVRRDAIKYGIPIRNKSEAQKNAITTGTHKHPTKGKKRDDKTKLKIGNSVMKSWEGLDDAQLEKRKITAKKNWEKLDADTKENILHKANNAVRESSKTGSKLEKFLLKRLIEAGYKVDFHKEQFLSNTKLQIDLFLPTMNIAIEVDGPSHFENIWGDQALTRNQKYDEKKSGLITGKGFSLIRIKQSGDFSETRSHNLWNRLRPLIKKYSSPDIININY